MLQTLLKISNIYELQNAINNGDMDEVIHRSLNLSGLEVNEHDIDEYDLSHEILQEKLGKEKFIDFESIDYVDNDSIPMCKIHESKSTLEFNDFSDSPAYLRKRNEEKLDAPDDSYSPELKALVIVLNESKSFNTLSIHQKKKLIEEFKEKLTTEKNKRNRFNATLPRPGSRTKLRNTIDRYVLNSKDKDIPTITDLKNKIITDGYLIIDPNPDFDGNIVYKESDKLRNVFGKELKNNSINDRSFYEVIRRSLAETVVNGFIKFKN